MNELSRLAVAFLAILPFASVSAAPDRGPPPASLATSLSPQQRGAAIGQFVRKWGPYVENVYGLDVGTWSERLVHQFVRADARNLQRALARTTLEGAMAELDGTGHRLNDEQVITSLAKSSLPSLVGPQVSPVPANFTTDLVFTPVIPCRLGDTRYSAGPIAANSTGQFAAWGRPDFTAFGGSYTDCGMLNDHPAAVMLNVTAVSPAAAGYATVYAGDLPSPPLASSINYVAGDVVNGIVVTRVANIYPDFKIFTYAASNYVVDIVGYFAAPHATPLDCTDVASSTITISAGQRGFGPTPACSAGYTPVFGGIAATGTSDNQTLNALDTDANTFFYSMTNTSANSKTFVAHTRCCRVPGR